MPLRRRGLALALALAGCAGIARYTRSGGVARPLVVRRVEWNPTRAEIGRVQAVVDGGDEVAVLTDRGALVLRSGAVTSLDPATRSWRDAAVVPAADGGGRWLAAIDGKGQLHRLRGGAKFEAVSGRYGLERDAVRAIASLGGDGGEVAFLAEGALAICDRTRTRRYATGDVAAIAGGGGKLVLLEPRGVRTLARTSGATRDARALPLDGARAIAVDAEGRLVVATTRALYRESAAGALELRYVADDETLHGVVASGGRVWFADGGELGVIDGENVRLTSGLHLDARAQLRGSPSGDVWALADGALLRYASDDGALAATHDWHATLSPVFGRACSACHLPDGSAGVDLSSAAAWESRRALIREKVLVKRSMPPAGHDLSDADRAAIADWLDASP